MPVADPSDLGTLVAVGERLHVPRLSVEQVQDYRTYWDKDPVRAMLRFPAFEGGGPTGARFEQYGAVAAHRVNLLPPDRKIGTWETGAARANAFRLATEWPAGLGSPRFLLLGRRVVDAFLDGELPRKIASLGGGRLKFGSIFFAWDRPCLALPHPSGRSRWWNMEGREELVQWWIDLFVRCFSS